MTTRKVGIEFYVAGGDTIARDVNKISQSVGSVTKMGLKLAGVNFTAMYVGRSIRGAIGGIIDRSPAAMAQMDRLNQSWKTMQDTVAKEAAPAVVNSLEAINLVTSSIIPVVGLLAKAFTNLSKKFADSVENIVATGGMIDAAAQARYRLMYPEDVNAFKEQSTFIPGYMGGTWSSSQQPPQNQAAYDAIRQQLLAETRQVQNERSPAGSVSDSAQAERSKADREAAIQQIEAMNAALDRQVLIQASLYEGQQHAAELEQYRATLERAYGDDLAKRVELYKGYREGLEAVAKIRQQIADREENERRQSQASDSVSRMNDELDRELLIIGRLNDSHERAARMVEYERQVRIAYADSLETQNRMLEEYEQKLRRLERQEQLVQIGKQFGDAWGDALEGFAVDGRKASEVARSLAKDLQRLVFRQMVTQPLANMISQGFISMFSGGMQTSAAGAGTNIFGGASVATATVHTGGVAMYDRLGSRRVSPGIFAGAGYAHGGLGPGEMPAIIRKDEGVFTPGQMRALGGGSARTEGLLAELLGEMRRQGEKRMMILDRRTGVTRDEVAGIIIDDLDHAGPVSTALGRG